MKTKEMHNGKTSGVTFGMRFKILFPVIIVNIVIAALLSALVLNEFEEQCIETAAQGALTIVTLAEARIDGGTLKNLGLDGAESTSYTLVYNSIESIVDSINVNRIYAVGYDGDGRLCYLIDILNDESDGVATGTAVNDFVELNALVAMSNDIPFAYKSIRQEHTGSVILAAAPVANRSGEMTGAESGWRLAQTQSMKETFTAENGYLFDFVDCNNNQKTQLQTLERFVEDSVQYIILDPIVEDGYEDVLKKAQDAGIPVIVVDRNISADASLYACWVGSDFVREGRDAAQWLVSFLSENGRESENLNILTILGSDGASATIGRTDGFEEIANEQSNWNLVDKQTGDFSKDGGYAVMKAYLDKYDNIDVVVCQNDDEAFGAVEAIKEAGRTCGPDGDIIIISFDATGAGFQAMIDGDINVDVECNPLEGPFVAELIQKLEKGETVEEIQYMEEGVFPAEEAEDVFPVRAY